MDSYIALASCQRHAITLLSIYRSTDGGSYSLLTDSDLSMTLTNSSTTYADTSAAEGHDYSYKLQATFSGGLGVMSDPADASTAPIQNLDYTPATTSQVLTWDNFSTSGTAIEIDISTDGTTFTSLTTTLAGSATTYTATSLTENTEYWFKVKITDGAGTTTLDPLDTWTLAAAPTSLTSTSASPTEIDLTWTNPGSSSTAFFIERSDDGGTTYAIIDMTAPGATSYQDTTVTDGTSYMYQVYAVSGDSFNGNPTTSTVSVAATVMAPTGLTLTQNGQNEIDLSWNNLSQSAVGYIVERSTDGSTFTTEGTVSYADTSYFSDTSVTAGTQYYYRVRAVNASSDQSAPSNVATTVTDPNISVSADSTGSIGTAITLTTTVPFASGAVDPVKGWTVDWGDGSTTNPSGTANGDPGSFTHTYTTPGSYTITASTIDGVFSGTADTTIADVVPTLTVDDHLSGGTSIAVTTPYQLDVAYTDPQGKHVTDWRVDWGDGTISTASDSVGGTLADTETFTHTYATPWTYAITVAAVADDGVLEWNKTSLSATGTSPTIGATISVDSVFGSEGVDNASVVFADETAGSTAVDYDIDWGDGSTHSTVSVIPGEESAATYHTYPHKGDYLVKVAGNSDTGYQTAIIGATTPTITAVPEQVVGAGSGATISTTFTDLAADTNAAAYIDWGDGTGMHKLTSITTTGTGGTVTATLPATLAPGAHTAEFYLYPLGKTPGSYNGDSVASASTTFTLDVWGVVIDHGESNDLLIASSDGTQNQQNVTLVFPRPAGEAVTLNLSSSNASQNYLFNSSGTKLVPTGSAYPGITISSGDTTSSLTLKDGAIAGNATAGALWYTLAGVANLLASTSTFEALAAAGAGTVPTTAPISNRASELSAIIASTNPDTPTNVTGQTRGWLAGELVDLWAVVTGPVADTQHLRYWWTAAGFVLYKYTDDDSRASVTSLKSSNTLPNLGGHGVGLAQWHLRFFYVHTWLSDNGPEDDPVFVDVSGTNWSQSLLTTFALQEPTSSLTVTHEGTTHGPTLTTFKQDGHKSLVASLGAIDPNDIENAIDTGIDVSGVVGMPDGFSGSGAWKFVQTIEIDDFSYLVNGSGEFQTGSLIDAEYEMLDRLDPYDEKIHATGTGSTMSDFPAIPLEIYTPDFTIRVGHDALSYLFTDYLMFKPPGSGSWVPVKSLSWSWILDARRIGEGQYDIEGTGPAPQAAVLRDLEPTWDLNVDEAPKIKIPNPPHAP